MVCTEKAQRGGRDRGGEFQRECSLKVQGFFYGTPNNYMYIIYVYYQRLFDYDRQTIEYKTWGNSPI